MRVALLGPISIVSANDAAVPVGGPRIRALLALLALQRGQVVSTSSLIDGIWGEQPPDGAANALQSLVKRLRAAIAPSSAIETRNGGYVLTIPPEAVDASRFTRLVAEGTWHLERGEPERAAELIDAALGLWRGAALADISSFAIFESAISALTEQRLTAIETRAQAYLALGRAGELIQQLTQENIAHPFRETLAACLIRAFAAVGRPAEAMRAFERTRHVLDRELAADPGQVLTAVLREIHAAPRQPPSTVGTTRLRGRPTSFVGRDDDIARLDRILSSTALITLVGPGGAGKTRLAVETAARVAARWSHGACMVELAAVTEPGLVGSAVLAALAVPSNRDEIRPDALAQVCSVLADKRVLLIIDNCEHVTAGAAPLVNALLRRCPALTIVATSREPLGIAGETLYPVTPLTLPAPRHPTATAAESAAVRLFIDRARAVLPAFALTDDNCEAVGDIVRRLDGVPLAIELAAARIRTMTPSAILERLDDRFLLLTNGYRTEAGRHRTLRAVVDWSWQLLDRSERELACRISIFVGGATLDAIERVCGGDLDTLASLVDKSLVEFDGARYRMLETIRAYAATELTLAGERALLESAHADDVLALVEQAEPALRTARQHEWVTRLTLEHDNCIAALGWAVRTADIDRSLRLCGSLVWYWTLCGFRAEAAHWCAQVLALVEQPPPGSTANYLACAFSHRLPVHYDILWWGPTDNDGDLDGLVCTAAAEQRQPNPVFVLVYAVRRSRAGDRALLDEAVRSTDPWLAANARLRRGLETLSDTGPEAAVRDLESALVQLREIGEPRALVRALLILARYRTNTLGLSAALPLMAEAAELTDTWLGTDEVVGVHTWLGQLRVWHGDIAAAAAEVAIARARLDATVPTFTRTWIQVVEAEIASRRGKLGEAIDLFHEALATVTAHRVRADRPVEGIATAVEIWGRTAFAIALLDSGDPYRAHSELADAFDLLQGQVAGNLPLLLAIGVGYASVALANGDTRLAVTIIGARDLLHTGPHRGPGPRQIIDVARIRLGANAVDQALGLGHALTLDGFRALLSECRSRPPQNIAPLARIV
ncbi:BTAD domain-containing putative transcriptional regulator [Nocardia tengchongensis]|uniref:BTAD domain-containing putative transcriptional regulator n=1 Tax=Nocardia tengchongensis TaxID=2055889 RepID=UPI003698B6ED